MSVFCATSTTFVFDAHTHHATQDGRRDDDERRADRPATTTDATNDGESKR
jgi:hypothetical protein